MDDRELEGAMREGLDRRAQRVDVAVPVADRARTDVRRRRVGRVTAGVAAAAVVAAGVTAVTLDRDSGSEQHPTGPPVAIDSGSGAEGVWRTEYWRDLQVDVPDSWGWGASPPASCVGAARSAGGQPVEGDFAGGYVGRPITSRRVCTLVESGPPLGPYVWLGAGRQAGVVDLGGGYVEETVKVNGSMLTVASDDAALRERILASATGGETCMSELDTLSPSFPKTVPGDVQQEADVLNVCVYQNPDSTRGQQAELVYATTLDLGGLHAYLRALEQGEEPRDQCPTLDYAEGEWVVLEIGNEDGEVFRRDVVHLFCPGIDVDTDSLSGFKTVRLTEEMVQPWAGEGIGAVVHGPTAGELTDHFIGPLW